ncbi:prenyltransferase/squalene oxidase repeat-containing protein [Streptomyces sp. I05A-00742]|uniref:prenyltransferase/squalene oxidase repeat-containing protein n=1 Tax=Streptomyces sp. I05A-00742 TaxID=2732853 RepID=UPI00148948FC|nr:prenyltransferase/squalene oxidase repeat-containing protein [Streptomyces sp. I05A-00742]
MAPTLAAVAARARRGATALAGAAVLSTAAIPAAVADTDRSAAPSTAAPGLYGTADPKFDGVFRQSLAFLAQHSTGVTPAKEAVDWLAGQQCADGGFPGFRADIGKPCDAAKDEFPDQTASAVQALAAVGGRGEQVKKGLDWLKAHQNADGGWGMNPGAESNANSTAAAIGAFAAAGQDPAKVASKGGKSPYDALLTFQLGCDATEAERGAFAWSPQKGKLNADNFASAAATTAALGKGYLVEPAGKENKAVEPLACSGDDKAKPKDAAAAAAASAAYLAKKLDAGRGHLEASMPGAPKGPDYGTTADAVTALAAGGHREAAGKALDWLKSADSKSAEWAKGDNGKGDPGRLAKLVLAARAAGADPRDFGGTDLVEKLNATGPAPESTEKGDEEEDEKGSSFGGWWFAVVCFVAAIGVGFLFSNRRKKQQ